MFSFICVSWTFHVYLVTTFFIVDFLCIQFTEFIISFFFGGGVHFLFFLSCLLSSFIISLFPWSFFYFYFFPYIYLFAALSFIISLFILPHSFSHYIFPSISLFLPSFLSFLFLFLFPLFLSLFFFPRFLFFHYFFFPK